MHPNMCTNKTIFLCKRNTPHIQTCFIIYYHAHTYFLLSLSFIRHCRLRFINYTNRKVSKAFFKRAELINCICIMSLLNLCFCHISTSFQRNCILIFIQLQSNKKHILRIFYSLAHESIKSSTNGKTEISSTYTEQLIKHNYTSRDKMSAISSF